MEQLRGDGRHDEADSLDQEMRDIKRKIQMMEGQQHDGPPAHGRVARADGSIAPEDGAASRQRHPDEADSLEQEMRDIKRKIQEMEGQHDQGPSQQGPRHDSEHHHRALDEAANHLSEAANRLHDVDMHDLADRICQAAEQVRREANKQRQPQDGQQGSDPLRKEIGQLRHDLDQLRDQVERLLDRSSQRPDRSLTPKMEVHMGKRIILLDIKKGARILFWKKSPDPFLCVQSVCNQGGVHCPLISRMGR